MRLSFIQGIRRTLAVVGQYDTEFQIKIGFRKIWRIIGVGLIAVSGAAPVLHNRNMFITVEDATGDAVAELIAVSCFDRIEFADVGGFFRDVSICPVSRIGLPRERSAPEGGRSLPGDCIQTDSGSPSQIPEAYLCPETGSLMFRSGFP